MKRKSHAEAPRSQRTRGALCAFLRVLGASALRVIHTSRVLMSSIDPRSATYKSAGVDQDGRTGPSRRRSPAREDVFARA